MKKSIITFLLILSSILLSVSGVSIKYAPFKGFSGVPLGNVYYQGGSNFGFSWGGTGETNKDTYADQEMIAIVSVEDITKEQFDNEDMVITVTCPNGMNMVSMSQPTFMRPIEIILYPSARFDVPDGGGGGDTLREKEEIVLSNENPIAIYHPGTFYRNDNGNLASPPTSCAHVWFDVVLKLPVDENGMDTENDRLTVNGNVYPLIRSNDYSALVTVSISYAGEELTFTMPFTGYYDGSDTPKNNADLPVALDVDVYPEATNIDLEKERGKWIDVGQLSFLFRDSTKNAALFISSSSNPLVAGHKFAMEKDDLAYNAPRTSSNSIGFTLRLRDNKGGEYIYLGDDSIAGASSIASLPSNFVKITQNTDVNFKIRGGLSYKEYQAEISIMLDSVDTTLLSGRYEEEIYCHVITE